MLRKGKKQPQKIKHTKIVLLYFLEFNTGEQSSYDTCNHVYMRAEPSYTEILICSLIYFTERFRYTHSQTNSELD